MEGAEFVVCTVKIGGYDPLDAFVRGDRGTLVLMLMDDPRTRSFDQAKKLIDTLLSQPWNTEAAAHYRG